MQKDPWEREIKSGARCAQYINNIDPKQGYGSRGLQAIPCELKSKFNGLKKDPKWRYRCRK